MGSGRSSGLIRYVSTIQSLNEDFNEFIITPDLFKFLTIRKNRMKHEFKILISPNSMKGSLNAFDFAGAIDEGFRSVSKLFNTRTIPVADGGDFTGEILRRSLGAEEKIVEVHGPLGDKIMATYWRHKNTAVIEMANASGMKRIESYKLNPMLTSSYGTGELIADAISGGCNEILLAIGGSATVDGGLGMLEALGFRFFDGSGNRLNGSGSALLNIKKTEVPENLNSGMKFRIICDVNNPLYGTDGAAYVFGPQKGAGPAMVELLDRGLRKWSDLIIECTGKKISGIPGMGAAGGISTGLVAFFNAEIVPGADFVFDLLRIDESIQWADLIITGEGRLDSQSLSDKAPGVLAKRAGKYGKPVIAITGNADLYTDSPFNGIFSIINQPMPVESAIENAYDLIRKQASQLALLIKSLRS